MSKKSHSCAGLQIKSLIWPVTNLSGNIERLCETSVLLSRNVNEDARENLHCFFGLVQSMINTLFFLVMQILVD